MIHDFVEQAEMNSAPEGGRLLSKDIQRGKSFRVNRVHEIPLLVNDLKRQICPSQRQINRIQIACVTRMSKRNQFDYLMN